MNRLLLIIFTLTLAAPAMAQFGRIGEAFGSAVDKVGDASAEMFVGPHPEEQRATLEEGRANALAKLHEQSPDMQKTLEESKGYAVFSNIGVNLLLVSTQRGGGILHDNRSGVDTYMKMFSAGGGLGLGVKDFAAIFVFHTDAALDQFVDKGWDFSAQADAKAQYKEDGEGVESSYSAMPGTSLYQLTESGLAAQLTLQGTKFWKDEELN